MSLVLTGYAMDSRIGVTIPQYYGASIDPIFDYPIVNIESNWSLIQYGMFIEISPLNQKPILFRAKLNAGPSIEVLYEETSHQHQEGTDLSITDIGLDILYSATVSERFSFQLGVALGAQRAIIAHYFWEFDYRVSELKLRNETTSEVTNLHFGPILGASFKLSERFSLEASGEYQVPNFEYEYRQALDFDSETLEPIEFIGEVNTTGLIVSVGLGYRL